MLETQLGTSIGREYSRMDQAVFEKHLRGVEAEVIEVDRQPLLRHDPSHPDADPQTGFVAFPDISPVEQMTNMIAAARMYDANAALSRSTKSMIEDAIQALSS
ncbi:MAG: Flagellar basal-body rod protein FlgC [candidate division BRC1 bacterium ADurb.BinA364]|nr:MAG: Flagellar basal-body rod protein FlgC [candidate division BRC1 bacterium ADurb.BinA364]